MWYRFLILIFCSLLFFDANSQERIDSFDATIKVEQSGKLTITEKIVIYAEGHKFKRGLLRFLPLTRKDAYGNNVVIDYHIFGIKRNGNPEKYFTEKDGDDWKIYIGDKDRYVKNGWNAYEITYTVPHQIGYFDDFDEIYWNVTGNEWEFNLENVSCEIILPQADAEIGNHYCYTGPEGSTATDCVSELSASKNSLTVTAVNVLRGSGLTVAAAFPKGTVDPPSFWHRLLMEYRKIKLYLWSIIFGISIPLLFFRKWKKYGKDPRKMVVIPEFRPPYDWSPALVGYANDMAIKDRAYMASMVNIAVKGGLKISSEKEKKFLKDKDVYSIAASSIDIDALSKEEYYIHSAFTTQDVVQVDDENYKIFEEAHGGWQESVKDSLDLKAIFLKNGILKVIAGLFGFASILLFFILSTNLRELRIAYWIAIVIAGVAIYFLYRDKNKDPSCLASFFVFFLAFPLLIFFIISAAAMEPMQLGVATAIIVSTLFFIVTAGKFTRKGAEIKNKLEGFKQYLNTAEKDRMNILNPPERTPELFEELLPYAIALGVEVNWGKQFEDVLEAAKYNPAWTDDKNNLFINDPSRFTSDLSRNLSSSKVNPTRTGSSSGSSSSGGSSYSSGSSGGGSSGGGGGGGGGGGW